MSSSDSESEMSSDCLDVQVKKYTPKYSEISLLLAQVPYITNPGVFLEKLQSPHVLSSGDLVLGVSGFAKYDDVRGMLNKRTKKIVNSMIDFASVESSEDVAIFFCPRIINIPLKEVHGMYRKVYDEARTTFKHFILASRLYALGKKEHQESIKIFGEFAREDLKNFPYCSEEVFLLLCGNRHNTDIDGVAFRIFLANRHEFENFLSSFQKEIGE